MIKWAGGTGDVRGAAAELHQSEEISSFPRSCYLKTEEGKSLWGLLPTFDSSGERERAFCIFRRRLIFDYFIMLKICSLQANTLENQQAVF